MENKINILVVDDDPIIITSAERVLNAEGYNVEGVLSGKDAMHRIEHNHYDLVLIDLKMLEIDGLALIKWIRLYRPAICIVVITGYLVQETIKDALKLGIHSHIMKPFTQAALKNVINKTIDWIKVSERENEQTEEFPPSMIAELDKVIHKYSKDPSSTMPVLLRAHEIFGYLPPVIQKHIARGLNIYPSEIHSIVSSNPFFRTKPRGDHTIRVCYCTECYIKGSERVLSGLEETLKVKVGGTTLDKKFTLDAARCVHACGQGPVMVIDKDTHSELTRRKAITFIKKYLPLSASTPPAECGAAARKEKYYV